MNCSEFKSSKRIEQYLLGQLGGDKRADFEAHYFACKECFEELETYRALQATFDGKKDLVPDIHVSPVAKKKWWVPVSLVATLAGLGLVVWFAVNGLPSREPGTLAELAVFDLPPYRPTVLRRVPNTAQQRFRDAMEFYGEGKPAAAIPGLREAAALDSKAANINFFFGICLLVTDQTADAIRLLRRTISLGETPYLEESHYYLAKAHLRESGVSAARRELEVVIGLRGDLETEAQRLLELLPASD